MDTRSMTVKRDRLGELFTTLRRAERRQIVRYLSYRDHAVAVPELVDAVDCPGVSVLHNHIPHLESVGVVEHGNGTVRRGVRFDDAVAILEVAENLSGA